MCKILFQTIALYIVHFAKYILPVLSGEISDAISVK